MKKGHYIKANHQVFWSKSQRLWCVYKLSRVLHTVWQMPYKRAEHISQMLRQLVGTAFNVAHNRHHSDSLFVNFQEPVVSWMP
jgi:hypothetical protein